MSGPLSVPVVCTTCRHTDLPWWQVGILTAVGCLIAYGLLWGGARLVSAVRGRRTPPASDSRQRTDAAPGGQPPTG